MGTPARRERSHETQLETRRHRVSRTKHTTAILRMTMDSLATLSPPDSDTAALGAGVPAALVAADSFSRWNFSRISCLFLRLAASASSGSSSSSSGISSMTSTFGGSMMTGAAGGGGGGGGGAFVLLRWVGSLTGYWLLYGRAFGW